MHVSFSIVKHIGGYILLTKLALCAFYLTTWEEYHTGTLYLGLVSGPVEGVLTLCVVFALTAFKGFVPRDTLDLKNLL